LIQGDYYTLLFYWGCPYNKSPEKIDIVAKVRVGAVIELLSSKRL
jgi:hypothetical protein